jgi:hypothetical protein
VKDLSDSVATSLKRFRGGIATYLEVLVWCTLPTCPTLEKMRLMTESSSQNPDLERWYATRANSHKVEVSGASHAVYVSRPKETWDSSFEWMGTPKKRDHTRGRLA